MSKKQKPRWDVIAMLFVLLLSLAANVITIRDNLYMTEQFLYQKHLIFPICLD